MSMVKMKCSLKVKVKIYIFHNYGYLSFLVLEDIGDKSKVDDADNLVTASVELGFYIILLLSESIILNHLEPPSIIYYRTNCSLQSTM